MTNKGGGKGPHKQLPLDLANAFYNLLEVALDEPGVSLALAAAINIVIHTQEAELLRHKENATKRKQEHRARKLIISVGTTTCTELVTL